MDGESHQIAILRRAAIELEVPKILSLIAQNALTPMAARRIESLDFFCDPETISQNLQEVDCLRRLLDDGESLPVEPFPDLEGVFSALKVTGASLAARDLASLSRLARMARTIRSTLAPLRETYTHTWHLVQQLIPLKELEAKIDSAIDPGTFEILDSASPTLRKLRHKIDSTQQQVRKTLQQILEKAATKTMLQEQLITLREGRLVLMVKDAFRRQINGIVHDESASGQTVFIEPVQTVALNNRVRQLQAAEREEIERILAQLSGEARTQYEHLRTNYEILIELDARQARAIYARTYACNSPQVNRSGHLVLYAARHPLLLHKLHDAAQAIPLDLQLNSQNRILIITGPNAGGKTVAMKTAGLAVLLTRLGLPIPASPDSEIGVMGTVFVDIGDQQSIESDLSTFSSHVARLKEMVEFATANDLVLIDEMGTGTDPEEGTALAVAVLRRFLERGVRCIATTHHGALKAFAHETEGIENGSMVFDSETLQPTYRFRPGVPGSSYAFEIAARMGLDAELIAAARKQVGSEKAQLEKLIGDLETKIQEHEQRIQHLKLEETRLAGLARLYRERAEHLAANERRYKQQAIEEAETILARANAAVEQAIRLIREQNASREAIRQAKTRVEEEKQALAAARQKLQNRPDAGLESPKLDPAALQAGKQVRWKTQSSPATVLEAPDPGGRVAIQVGSLRLRVPVSELEALPEAPRRQAGRVTVEKPGHVAREIDVRGMRAEEAIAAVDSYLSDAILYGWEQVRIIHGKGSGALRKAINEFLAGHPQVAGTAFAEIGKGDLGVTEVLLA